MTGQEMIQVFNAVLECFVTGLFTAICIWGMAKIGIFPIMFLAPKEEWDEDGDES